MRGISGRSAYGPKCRYRHFGPFFIKFCGYFPYTGQIYFNGHEYAKRQCLKEGIGFTALDNAFGAVSDPAAVQRICDGLTDQKIYRFAGKWLARLPQPFTRADQDADYRWQLSVHQVEFSTTMALDRPVAGRIFSGAADPRQPGHRPPGQGEPRLRPDDPPARQVPHPRDLPHPRDVPDPGHHDRNLPLPLPVLQEGPGQAVPEGRKGAPHRNYPQPAARPRHGQGADEPRRHGEGGLRRGRRLLDAECISHDPAAGTAALEMLTSPVISTTCTRVPGMRFPDPRVQALLAACCALALRPAGFTSRDLRHLLAPQLGRDPGDMTGGQISYDLRRLRAHQIIQRIPHSRTYQVTAGGLSTALFFTRLTRRVIIPALAGIAGAGPPPGSPLRQADPAYKAAIADLASQASLGIQTRSVTKRRSRQAPVVTRNPS
jgi:hypothetical protein